MNTGKLQYRQNVAHGNPYFRLLRIEVESLALELRGAKGISILKSSSIDDFKVFTELAPIFLSDVFSVTLLRPLIQIRHLKYLKAAAGSKRILG